MDDVKTIEFSVKLSHEREGSLERELTLTNTLTVPASAIHQLDRAEVRKMLSEEIGKVADKMGILLADVDGEFDIAVEYEQTATEQKPVCVACDQHAWQGAELLLLTATQAITGRLGLASAFEKKA